MRTSHKHTHPLLVLMALLLLGASALAADPGATFPFTSELSDQKPGSVLIYNVYSSSAANPAAENTEINITNTSTTLSAFVHFFFIDGSNCGVADAFVCLTANQTTHFLMSDIDPGVMGYIIAVASSPDLGCPISHNFLIGDEFVKFASGHFANLGAEAVSALATPPALCDGTTVTATLSFNGAQYGRLPRVLAADSIASNADGNSTLIIINRIGGSMITGLDNIGTVFGILFDDIETGLSFNIPFSGCQRKAFLSDSFPRTTPRFSTLIPQGRTGWAKFWAADDRAITGAQITFNPSAGIRPGAFSGGHNLHKLTLTGTSTITIPIFNPTGSC